jgi:prophage DNA circulation protein
VRTQIQPLEGAISGFTAAVENLGPTASSLRAAANALAPALQRVTEIQLESHHQLERMHQMIDATGVALEAASNKMNDAAGALERLPERLEGRLAQELVAMSDGVKDLFRPVAESLSGSARSLSESAAELDCVPARLTATFQTELAGMTENALKAWDKTTQEFTRTVSDSALGYISAIAKAAADATGELVSAAHDMREVSLAAKATLEGALTRFLESGKEMLRPVVRDIDEAVQRRMPAVLASLRTAVESAKDLETSAEQVKNTITALTGTLDGANSSWRALIVQVESAIAKLDRTLPPPAPVLVPSCPNGQADDIKQIRADVGRISAKLDRRRRWWLFPCARTGANV